MDNNFLSFAHERPLGYKALGVLVPPAGTDDTLKITDCDTGRVDVEVVVGGREDCLDVNNRSYDIEIGTLSTIWEPRGKYVATIKGGSRSIVLKGVVRGHGKVCDVDLGNWSDQSQKVTERITLNLRHEKGEPITYRVLNAKKPVLIGGPYKKVLSVPGWLRPAFVLFYKLLKKVGLG
jgi:hypothetical protein